MLNFEPLLLKFTFPVAANTPEPESWSVPFAIVVPPEYVLAAVKTQVLVPCFVIEPVPLMTPEKVTAVPVFEPTASPLAPKLTLVVVVPLKSPIVRIVPVGETPLTSKVVELELKLTLLLLDSVPDPEICNFPAAIVVAPE